MDFITSVLIIFGIIELLIALVLFLTRGPFKQVFIVGVVALFTGLTLLFFREDPKPTSQTQVYTADTIYVSKDVKHIIIR